MMMLTHDDWDAALEAAIESERGRLGGPPTPEEVVAFKRRELSERDAARVRALLVYYSELTPLLDDMPAPRNFRRFLPIAASVLLAVIVPFSIYTRWQLVRAEREMREPIAHESRLELSALQARGLGSPAQELPAHETHYLIAALLSEKPHHAAYRLDIVDLSAKTPRTIWSDRSAQPIDDAFELSIPRAFLHEGLYRIDIYGVSGANEELLERLPFRVPVRHKLPRGVSSID